MLINNSASHAHMIHILQSNFEFMKSMAVLHNNDL